MLGEHSVPLLFRAQKDMLEQVVAGKLYWISNQLGII
jgi:hypothetical protein